MHESVHTRRMPRPRKPSITLPAHVHRTVSRGKEYFTYQHARGTKRAGPRIKLPHPADEGFLAAVRRAAGPKQAAPRAGTFEALIEAYHASPEWAELSAASRSDYGRYLNEIGRMWGDLRVADLRSKDVLALRDKRASKPGAANYLIRVLSTSIAWGIPRGYREDNPCEHVRKLKIGEGWQAWPWEMIEKVRALAPAELWQAAALALYTGQRQRDVLNMKLSDIADNRIAVHQAKTKVRLLVPLHKDLAAVLSRIERRSLFILTNTRGVPWTQSGFKASWGKMCARIGIDDHLVFHGLRKSAVVMLLEAGCTTAEVSAITGQSMQMVEHYAKQVNQKRLAASAILKWERTSL